MKPRTSHPIATFIKISHLAVWAVAPHAWAQNLVTNGDFDANAAAFNAYPGYLSSVVPSTNPASIPGWGGGIVGINGSQTSLSSSPFGPTTNAPHYAFLQYTSGLDQTISTTAGQSYLFSFEAAARAGQTSGVNVTAGPGNPKLTLNGGVAGSWWLNNNAFQRYAFAFTAESSSSYIRFDSVGSGDHTTNIDKVSVTPIVNTITIPGGTTFFTNTSGTIASGFHLAGDPVILFQRAGSRTYTGNITTDGATGLNLHTGGRNAGASTITFDGSTINLGNRVLSIRGDMATYIGGVSNPNDGGILNVADANNQKTVFHNANLTTTNDIWISRSAVEFSGNSVVNIGGQIREHAVNNSNWILASMTIRDNAAVTVAGGLDFRNFGDNLALNGGTLTTPYIRGNNNDSVGSKIVFNGTRIIASQSSADFLRVSTAGLQDSEAGTAHLGTGGAIFDTNGFNITVAPPLADLPGHAGILKKIGSGSLLLTGANTYSGGTIIEGGYIMVNGGTNGGNLGSGPVTLNGGGFKNNDSTPSIDTLTTLGPSGGYFTAGWNKYVSLVGQITGTGALNVNTDGGTVYLYNSSNNYAGSTNIGTTGPGYFDQTTIAKLQLANSNVLPDGTTVNLLTAASVLNLNGNSETIGGLTGSGSVTLGGGALTVGGNGIGSSFAGTISGAGTLAKTGGGTLTLSGNSNYAGGTTVAAGGLTLNSVTGAGSGAISLTGVSSVLTLPANVTLQNSITLSKAGASIIRSVATGGAYNLGTTGTLISSFAGGKPDTAARILAGTNAGAAETLTMGFSDTSSALNDGLRRTDVLSLSGMTGTDAFVLQIVAAGLQSDSVLGWKNGSVWDWAVNGNTGNNATAAMRHFMGSFTSFQTTHGTNLSSYIGAFGYDANAGGTGVGGVWAVLNHNSEFSGIPELSNILAGLLLGAGLLRRRR